MIYEKTVWTRVRRDRPCPICGKADWCSVSHDGSVAICMRQQSSKSLKDDKGWLHNLSEPIPDRLPPPTKRTSKPTAHWQGIAAAAYSAGGRKRIALSRELGVSVAALELLEVGAGYDDRRNLSYSTWPERDAKGNVIGINRRYPSPVSHGSSKLMIPGSRRGLYWGKHKSLGPSKRLYIPEGGTDTATLISNGMSAVGRPSNTGCLPELATLLHGFRFDVIILGERDKKMELCTGNGERCTGCSTCWPGVYGAKRTRRALYRGAFGKDDKRVRMMLPQEGYKDVREWYAAHHGATEDEFISTLVEIK